MKVKFKTDANCFIELNLDCIFRHFQTQITRLVEERFAITFHSELTYEFLSVRRKTPKQCAKNHSEPFSTYTFPSENVKLVVYYQSCAVI